MDLVHGIDHGKVDLDAFSDGWVVNALGDTDDEPATLAALDQGVKCFVPWSLYADVAEWNFYPAGDNPARIIDEHWYMTPYYYVRDTYYLNPRFPLTGVNITKDDYVDGPLENWTKGACTFNGKDQYAVCPNAKLNQTLTIPIRFRWDKSGQREDRGPGGLRRGHAGPRGRAVAALRAGPGLGRGLPTSL